MKKYLFFLFLLFFKNSTFANDYETQEITVFDKEMFEPSQSIYLDYQSAESSELNVDIFKELLVRANLLMTKTNMLGGTQNLYLRGISADQIQISYDGAILNDPSNVSRGYNFSELSSFNLSAVDIYYGSHASTLGAFANAGAINFKSRNVDNPLLIQKVGSYQTLGTTFLLPIAILNQQWEVQTLNSRGMSSYDAGEEHDGIRDFRAKIKGESQLSKGTQIKYFILTRSRNEDLDFGGGSSPDDQDYNSKEKMLLPFFQIQNQLDECYDLKLKAQRTVRKRETLNQQDSLNNNQSYFLSRSLLDIANLSFEQKCKKKLQVNFQADYAKESMSTSQRGDSNVEMSSKSQEIHSLAFNQDYKINKKQSVHAGARLESWEENFQLGSYRVMYNSALNETISLSPSFSQAKKIPSLYQLYSDVGNPNLKREENWQVELVSKMSTPQIDLELAPYYSNYSEMVDYNLSTNKYVNSGKNIIYGIESRNFWKIHSSWSSGLNINYLRSYNQVNSQALLLRPKWQAMNSINYFDDKKSLSFQTQYLDHREGLDAITFNRVRVPSHLLFHIVGTYKFSSKIKADVSLQNILNKKYNMIPGYQTLGLAAFMDLTWAF
jgi:vitamin B12 transporter